MLQAVLRVERCRQENELHVRGDVALQVCDDELELFLVERGGGLDIPDTLDHLGEFRLREDALRREEALRAGDSTQRACPCFCVLLNCAFHGLGDLVEGIQADDTGVEVPDYEAETVVLHVGADGRVLDFTFYAGRGEDSWVADSRELEDLGGLDGAAADDDLAGCRHGILLAVEGDAHSGGSGAVEEDAVHSCFAEELEIGP